MKINFFVKKSLKTIYLFIFYLFSVLFFLFITLQSYLFFQSIKNNGAYFKYMEKCVDEGNLYWACHMGEGE